MPTLQLTTNEAGILKEILQDVLSDLSAEIADTDLKSYRDKLKEKEQVIKAVCERLDTK